MNRGGRGTSVFLDYLKQFPDKLPAGVLHSSNAKTITIFDMFKKAEYHLLVLPKDPYKTSAGKWVSASRIESLEALLKLDPTTVLDILKALEEVGKALKIEIEKEMMEKVGWIGPIFIGFHGLESQKHVHLHIVSGDFLSPKLKHNKHYNSFNPNLNFFHPISEIIEALEKQKSFKLLTVKEYEAILRGPLVSFYTGEEFKDLAALKVHLEVEWKKLGEEKRILN